MTRWVGVSTTTVHGCRQPHGSPIGVALSDQSGQVLTSRLQRVATGVGVPHVHGTVTVVRSTRHQEARRATVDREDVSFVGHLPGPDLLARGRVEAHDPRVELGDRDGVRPDWLRQPGRASRRVVGASGPDCGAAG